MEKQTHAKIKGNTSKEMDTLRNNQKEILEIEKHCNREE